MKWADAVRIPPRRRRSRLLTSSLPTHTNRQVALCLLILALLGWWVQESLDPRDKPREPFNLCRTHNTLAVLYQFLLTYRSVSFVCTCPRTCTAPSAAGLIHPSTQHQNK